MQVHLRQLLDHEAARRQEVCVPCQVRYAKAPCGPLCECGECGDCCHERYGCLVCGDRENCTPTLCVTECVRVDGGALCPACKIEYRYHPRAGRSEGGFYRACDGTVVKT